MKFPEEYRMRWQPHFIHLESKFGDPFGYFAITGRIANERCLICIADSGAESGWEHVSVSLPDTPRKCPSWDEMCVVKRLFWDEEECVLQYHPAKSDYVNFHPGVLHLWRPVNGKFPMPPKICV